MSEKYTVLQHNTNTYRVVECPLILTSHALTKDNQIGNIFIQCRFENVDSKPIKALYIDVLCADVTNQALQSVENFSYLDIDVGQYQSFGDKTPVYLPDKETRSISIGPKKIVFSDGSTWSNESDTAYELLEANQKPIAELGELTDQYRRELHSICAFSEKHSCLPARKDGFIICGCGKVVLDNAKSCPLCGVEFEKLFALNDADKLQAGLEQCKQEQAEREEQERQAAEEKRKHAEEMKQQTIKTAKKVGIIGGCVAVLVAVCLLVVQVIIPNVRYSMASNAITAGNYEDAISTFEDLEDFKDSQEKIKEAQYAWAESKLASGDEDGAIELFEQLGDYNDSADRIKEIHDSASYEQAEKAFENGNYEEAKTLFENLGSYSDSASRAQECSDIIGEEHYSKAVEALNKSDHDTALKEFLLAVPYKDSIVQARKLQDFGEKLDVSGFTVAAKSDGTVLVAGYNSADNNDSETKVENWSNIKAVYVGGNHTIGLKYDGSVVAAGSGNECNVDDWSNINSIAAGGGCTIGLMNNGRVLATGNNGSGQCNVNNWMSIASISNNSNYTVGLKTDGTVVATGENMSGQCNVSDWNDIIAIELGSGHTIYSGFTVGLKSDGTVVATGDNDNGQCNVSSWRNVVDISALFDFTVGLKSDGTVVATGNNFDGQCNVNDWSDIIAISAGRDHTVGLKSNGTVVSTGNNDDGQCNVIGWKNIVAVWAGVRYTVGLKSDGTVVATGRNNDGQCNVEDWDLW